MIGPVGKGAPGGSMITGPLTAPPGGMVTAVPPVMGEADVGMGSGFGLPVSDTFPLGMTLGVTSRPAAVAKSGDWARTTGEIGTPSRAAGADSCAVRTPGAKISEQLTPKRM